MAATNPQDGLPRPPTFAETGRRSSSSRNFTSGRGGAGNIASSDSPPPATCPTTLETPTIKAPTYTTGRGGSGNMAQNSCAIETRKAQDIQAHPRSDSISKTHVGRGGGGNFVRVNREDKPKLVPGATGESAVDSDSSGDEAAVKEGGRERRGSTVNKLKGKVMGALGMKS